MPNFDQYLNPIKIVLKNSPEIRNRADMLGVVAADLKSYIQKHGIEGTAYEIAKKTFHHKAQVYAVLGTGIGGLNFLSSSLRVKWRW